MAPPDSPVSVPVVVMMPRPLCDTALNPPGPLSVTVPALPWIGPAIEMPPLRLSSVTPDPLMLPVAVTLRPAAPDVVSETSPLLALVTAPDTLRPSELSAIVIAPPAVRLPIAPNVLPALVSVTLPPTLPVSVPVVIAAICVTLPARASPPAPPSTTLPPVLVVMEPITTFPPASSSEIVPFCGKVVSSVPVRLIDPSWASIVIVDDATTWLPLLFTPTPVRAMSSPRTNWPLRSSQSTVVVSVTSATPVPVQMLIPPVSFRPPRSLTTTAPP